MKVHGVEITPEQIAAAERAMQERKTFTATYVKNILVEVGVPKISWSLGNQVHYIAERAADRIIQRLRKAGNIHLVSGRSWEVA